MAMRRRLCVLTLAGAVLFLTLASHSHFLSLTPPTRSPAPPMAPPTHLRTVVQGVEPVTSGSRTHPSPEEAPPLLKQNQEVEKRCGCDSCVSDLNSSDWFKQRFDPQKQPILTQNHSIDAQALNWWMSLQRSGNGRSLQEVMSEMFSVIAPPPEQQKPRPSVCRTCAVVGNSGNLRKSGYGSLIDSHQSVLRMNKALTSGFEQDVGNRSTHHFLYPESAVDLQPGVHMVLVPFKIRDLEWVQSALSTGDITMTYMRVKGRVSADRDQVLVLSPDFFKYVHERWTQNHGRYPSTGLTAVVYALHTCDQVSLFGFGADSEGNWHHYWEKNRFAGAFRKTGVHNADYETQLLQRLHQEGKVQLYQG
ncbi:ST3 beta-galactoside alpha-2,3-sialyltransferase 8 [Eucyclogobius newberryi]|uniref:ST3 beta-galactoside alpha-2,3-sialyltransferase 8 n=1 Tax=Eucyclogobius newberryi TaxID=166745 RepID=UPI003B59BA22